MSDIITLAHGSGGKLSGDLIRSVFYKHLSNDILMEGNDGAQLPASAGKLAFTTDSFVIHPIFFRGGDIGKLSVCGTVNDLVSCGAKPLYLSCGFILEEGLPVEELEQVAASMGQTARACGVKVVTGDTKVVQKGAGDRIYINTSGIGVITEGIQVSGAGARPGDQVIITGDLGDHGCAVLLDRERMDFQSDIRSDCAPLNDMMEKVFGVTRDIHVLRDPTRGGLATTLNEIAQQSGVGIRLYETQLPIKNEVRGICSLLGMDPLYMANEGKMVVIAPPGAVSGILEVMNKETVSQNARVIGEVLEGPSGTVFLKTLTGGNRILDMLVGDQLPRIC